MLLCNEYFLWYFSGFLLDFCLLWNDMIVCMIAYHFITIPMNFPHIHILPLSWGTGGSLSWIGCLGSVPLHSALSVHYFWWRWWTCLLTWDWVRWIRKELYHIKNRVEVEHGCQKVEPVHVPSDFLHYREGAKVAVGMFLWGACSADVACIQVHLVSNLLLWHWNLALVAVLCHVILGLCESRLCFH